ncbi:MAG: hypothetical protein FWF46_00805 [Oscillospiraceae bacterium]|nr:hypothetical protein [Oscillospiraceae bacterium]
MGKKKIILIVCIILVSIIVVLILTMRTHHATKGNDNNNKARFMISSDVKIEVTHKSNMKNKVIKENGVEKTVKYEETKLGKDIYISSDGDEYDFSGNEMVSFWEAPNEKSTKKVSDTEAEKLAKEFCEKNIENFSKYTLLSDNYDDTIEQHTVVYMHKIQGYNTIDQITVFVDNYSEIKSFVAYYQDALDKYENISINKDDINNAVEEEIKSKYNDTLVKSSISSENLSIIDNKCVMIIGVDVQYKAEATYENGDQIIIPSLETVIYALE